MRLSVLVPLAALAFATLGPAQRGDRQGEAQPELKAEYPIPPAPALSPADERATFELAPELRVDLIAAEPLVCDPVQAVFDERGRLWVVEMRGFMRDVDATKELEAIGRVVVLTDRDGDGVMDESIVFQDGLVLPRAVGLVRGGALVLEPPNLWIFDDRDGDLRADGKRLVATGFEAGLSNPEHAANGLVRGLDNWIECANWGVRLRVRAGAGAAESVSEIDRERTFAGGQWGVCFDDLGRRYYDYNSDFLRMDAVPGRYAVRMPELPVAPLWNLQVVKDQSTWPIRVTPGVNRGYQKGQLRADGTLATCTAACAPLVDRGGLLPAPYARNAFVCEPAGNLVARFALRERERGSPLLEGADPEPGRPFLASRDERFRPVNLTQGPDGAIYVVDMYRGLIQHKNFVTTFLRKQVVARQLEAPVGMGRIWRIAPKDMGPRRAENLGALSEGELVARLASDNGFVRTEAQRMLVDRPAVAAREALGATLAGARDAHARLHALWTLEGLAALTPLQVAGALADAEPAVRAAALRQLEPRLLSPDPRQALEMCEAMADDPSPLVRVHCALVLGSTNVPRSSELLARLACRHGGDPGMPTAIASGASGRAAEIVALVCRLAEPERVERACATLELLCRCIAAQRDPAQALAVLALATSAADAKLREALREALLSGLSSGLPKALADCAGLLASEEALGVAEALQDQNGARAARIRAAFARKGGRVEKLAGSHERARRAGMALFGVHCSACHQQDGKGLAGLAPSLHDAPLVQDSPDRTVRIVLHGLAGQIKVGDDTWNLSMPALPHLDDAQVAAVVTFVRGQYGRREEEVTSESVRVLRERWRGRATAWTAEELGK